MPNPYVVPSKDVQIYLTFEGLPAIKIGTGTSLNLQYSQTVQDIFAIGETDPIDLVQLNAQYAANLSHQTGEQHTILDAINGALPAGQTPYASMLQLPPFTLTKTMSLRNSATPKTVSESLLGCKCEQSSSDTNRNDAETLSSINIRARAVQRSVAPIQTIV